MATLTGNFVSDNSTLANFKSWAQSISTAFSTFGWTQTTDTGQVNWSTIGAVPSSPVYEIWKSADALSSTMPIFVKIQYGTSTQPTIIVQLGTGSNGSGTLTGPLTTAHPVTGLPGSGGAATTFPCYFSGSNCEIRVGMWANPAVSSIPAMFCIERSKDTSGNNTADYVTYVACATYTTGGGQGAGFQQTMTSSAVSNVHAGPFTALPQFSSGSDFGTVAAYPLFPSVGKVGNPMLGLMAAPIADAAINSIVTVSSMYGSTHTYVAFGSGSTTWGSNMGCGPQGLSNAAMLLRYE
jgi:hypothetical protein